MVCNLPELSLDLCPPVVKLSLSNYLNDFPMNGELCKLIEFIDGLEDEIKKIQAFQRELPLSFNLLNDAIGKFKEEVKKYEVRKPKEGEKEESERVKMRKDEVVEKKDWMSSVQLWAPSYEEKGTRIKAQEGAVLSFKEDVEAPGLSLVTPAVVEPSYRMVNMGVKSSSSVDLTIKPESRLVCQTASRKQRRCWSPELHRRFIDALEKLGGPQVATPKQIREQMHVDGLTNDEVKSHLQKYRLHIRKLPAGSTKTTSSMDQGMRRTTLELGYSNSGSPEGPLHYVGSKKGTSSSMDEDEEENSDGHNWNAQQHM